MSKFENVLMTGKFRGCLLGALIGDCLGAPFEGDVAVSKVVLQQYFDRLSGPYVKAPFKPYTGDTAMTVSLAFTFIGRKEFHPQDLAKRLVAQYFDNIRRGYSNNLVDVFMKLRAQKFQDPYGPAKEQFGGAGSLGNGGATRVAPLSLFYHGNYVELLGKAKLSAEVTHSHRFGVDGTILQAIAVHQSLHSHPDETLDVKEFSNELLEKMAIIEEDEERLDLMGPEDPHPFQTQLQLMQDLLDKGDEASDEDVQKTLGNSIAALFSVPTAIYCFLRAQQAIPGIDTDNPFQRTIQYAISLGGDTNTIASMAGAIAGAYYGSNVINRSFIKHCEKALDVIQMADLLYHAATTGNPSTSTVG